MKRAFDVQRIISESDQLDHQGDLPTWAEGFLMDRKVRGLSDSTLMFYKQKLALFQAFAESREITQVEQITPNDLRLYLISLEENHKPGGIAAAYRGIRAFLRWYEAEVEPEGWKNPIDKVPAPKAPLTLLEPVELKTVKALINACEKDYTGYRDIAILLTLLDTGLRASELLDLDLEDVNQISGEVLVRKGKGSKSRTVFLGRKARMALRKYLKQRPSDNKALWLGRMGDRLSYWGLRNIINRRSNKAGVETPTLHSFRRAFALAMLRNGTDVFTLKNLMGHADLTILQRYLKQTTEDLQAAHRANSPVDRSL